MGESDRRAGAFAGLWETHDEFGQSCTIVTTEANAFMARLHDRMPVILEPETWSEWLDGDAARDDVQSLIQPAAGGVLASYPVSPAVGDSRKNGPESIAAIASRQRSGELSALVAATSVCLAATSNGYSTARLLAHVAPPDGDRHP